MRSAFAGGQVSSQPGILKNHVAELGITDGKARLGAARADFSSLTFDPLVTRALLLRR